MGIEWLYLAVMLIGVAYTMSNMPKQQAPTALGLEDVQAPVAEIGKEIPVLFGTRDIASPNVVWYGDLRTKAIKVKTGK